MPSRVGFHRRFGSGASRGFTLTELMVVVVIAGVLIMVAVQSLRTHVKSARSVEVHGMVQSIRAAQERYRSLNGRYLDVSSGTNWYPRDPGLLTSRGSKVSFHPGGGSAHPDRSRWLDLSPTVAGPVRFGYHTTAGLAGDAMTAPLVAVSDFTWSTPTEPWFVIQAIADADEDGVLSFHLASSLNGELYVQNEGE